VGRASVAVNIALAGPDFAGDREAAIEAYKATEEKTAGAGLKMDLVFAILR
jgi:hypothetical protein